MKKKFLFVCLMLLIGAALFAQEAAGEESGESLVGAVKYIAAALAVGLSCLAGGIAVGRVGAAAMGAMSENADLSGKALPYAGLAEGICLWGFLVALLILFL
jgi:V/A-type H+-transporting ATPase subunit K